MISNKHKSLTYIVNAGCSYGVISDSYLNFICHLQNDTPFGIYDKCPFLNVKKEIGSNILKKYVFINVNRGGMTSQYITDSVIYAVDVLLEKGVPPNKIHVISEFTNFERPTYNQPLRNLHHDFFNLNKNATAVGTVQCTPENNEIIDWFYGLDKLTHVNGISTFYSLGKMIYMNAQGAPSYLDKTQSKYLDDDICNHTFGQMNEFKKFVTQEYLLKLYLDNILRLQYYLKSHNIKYNSFFINSQFSHFDYHDGHLIRKQWLTEANPYVMHRTDSRYRFKNKNFKEYYNATETNDISNIYPPIKQWIDKIDFSNWWMYETDEVRYGGVDEYAIYNFDWYGYLKTIPNTPEEQHIPYFFNHPSQFVYVLLWNEIVSIDELKLTDDYLNWIKEGIYFLSNLKDRTNTYLLNTEQFHKDDIKNP